VSRWNTVYKQLKDRRVIRTSVLYLALFWGAVEVADLLAGAEMISEDRVRWLLLAGVVCFPVILVLSWFVESPWKERGWFSVLGDVSIILAIAVGALLFAREQFVTSFTRPVVAFIRIEPTDTRTDTADLAEHLSGRFRMLLATRPEIRVLELASSQSLLLSELPVVAKASALGADFLIGGTVNQGNGEVRLNVQLFAADGELLWSDRFTDRLIDQAQVQNRVLNELWPHLPLSGKALEDVRELVVQCEYPASTDAIHAITGAHRESPDETEGRLQQLSMLIDQNQDNGLLHLARAEAYFNALKAAPLTTKSVLQNLAMRDLDQAASQCPGHPGIETLRLYNTLQLQGQQANQSQFLTQFPNESRLRYELATSYYQSGDLESASPLAAEAWVLNPLNTTSLCFYQKLLQSQGDEGGTDALLAVENSMRVIRSTEVFYCP
jgi:TolB-like protein